MIIVRRLARAAIPALLSILTGLAVDTASAQSQSAIVAPQSKAPPFDLEKSLQTARQTVKTFADRLKTDLATAIKTDGLASAVALCQTLSPDIPTQLSDETGFEISRTALKLRNPENAPSPWELGVLKGFEEQVAKGADPHRLEHFEIIKTPEGDKLFRYMKSIPVGEICLGCHGTNIKPDVQAELNRYYPDDKAKDYRLGELRGAFSLVKLINE
ncbi:MAG: DUF3365 domain-containing protein [Hyphomicrobiaceae bacterium]